MSPKVKCDSGIQLPIYGFILTFNSNICFNSAPLRDIRVGNLSDVDFDLSRSLKIKYDGAIRLPIYEFLLMYNSEHMSISHRLGGRASRIFSPISYHEAEISAPHTLTSGFSGKAPNKNEVDWLNTF